METREILARFASGELSKSEALALMRSGTPGAAAPASPSSPESAGAQEPVAAGEPAGVPEPVAVIGCSARFPGAPDLDAFRRVVREGRDTVREVPAERWPAERWYDADPAAPGRSLSRWGGLVEDAAAFDAEQFRMTPREAELTDPQARLFLQECFRAVENAGYAPSALAGTRCGVHAGVMLNDYAHRIERSSPHARLPQVMQGNSQSILAARVAYLLDLAGPVTAVDTACSSSLVALHQACQALWLGEADMMLAGGVTLYTTELPYIFMSKAGMLSPTGRCRPFDASADGFVPGEGSAVVMLKTLRRAMADGDPVQLVIRASGVNHDGFTNGLTAPSPRAQAALVRDVYSRFGIDPATIDYVECHGTGTPLGDPIEIAALNEAFGGAGLPAGHIPVGSVKGNVGHTSAAAGLAGLFKALEVVTSGQVPPSLHFTHPNPRIPFGQGPFRVASGPEALPSGNGRPWRAAVSSFGLSGTNAHVVVEAPPAREPDTATGPALVVLSARRRDLLTAQSRALAAWLAGPGSGAGVHEVARTLALGRSHGPARLAVVAHDRAELRSLLDAFAAGRPDEQWAASTADGAEGDRVRQAQQPLLERLYERLSSRTRASRDDLLALGRLYAQQHDVDWRRIHPAGGPRAVALPGSVLASDRYWVEEAAAADPAPVGTPGPDGVTVPDGGAAAGPRGAESAHGRDQVTHGSDHVNGARPLGDPVDPGAAAWPAARDGRDAGGPPELPGVSLYVPQWLPQPAGPAAEAPGTLLLLAPPPGTRAPGGPDGPEDLRSALAAAWTGPVRLVGTGGEPVEDAADPAAYPAGEPVTLLVPLAGNAPAPWWTPLFGAVRELLTRLWKRHVHLVAVAEERTAALAAAGFVQTLAHENPRLTGRAVRVDRLTADRADLLAAECADRAPQSGRILELRPGHRGRRLLSRLDAPATAPAAPSPLRRGTTHLVTGGLGGLGVLTARHLIEGHGARVVLCGRRPEASLTDADRAALAGLGSAARYVPVDVTDETAVRGLVENVLATEGALHGVFHAAGTLRDAYLVKKRPADADAVISPKALGARALDAATAGLGLDVFVLFASLSGTVGNLGQSDYATGNGFLDGFAEERRDAVARGERSGRTLSIGWPLWRDGGMSVPDAVLTTMRERTGAEPLPAGPGFAALDALLRLPDTVPAVAVFHGERERWERSLDAFAVLGRPTAALPSAEPSGADGPRPSHSAGVQGAEPASGRTASAPAAPSAPAASSEAPARSETVPAASGAAASGLVRRAVADVTGVPESAVRMGASLQTLGFDSLTLRALSARLAESHARVEPTEIFAADSLDEVAALAAERSGRETAGSAAARTGTREAADEPAPAPPAPTAASSPSPGTASPAAGVSPRRSAGALAVVGMSGRYPDAPDLSAFAANLREGRDTSGPVPADRWDAAGTAGSTDGVRGHFLTGVDRFDPEFFGLSTYESALVDPQERLFLETAVEALEDAGALGERLDSLRDAAGEPRSVGVFVGVTSSDYQKVGVETWGLGNRTVPAGHYWSIANRLSYLLDLRGPSQPVDTACSSSLTALHLAARAVEHGECAAALVGGVNLYLHPSRLMLLKEFGFLSPDGRCRSFGSGGTGFGPGEGVGAVVVKPLERALADGDQVYAVIRGTAVGHAGRSHGYTAPSPRAQARVLRRALEQAGVDPSTVGLIEAHGTGTELGDPIEVAALTEVFGERAGTGAAPIALGSVKSQIGHGESVAGLAALTKTVLQLRHRELLPTLHADDVNPALDLSSGPFALSTGHAPWPAPAAPGEPGGQGGTAPAGTPRRAGVSSFGAGGVNTHAVVEEYDPAWHGAPRPGGAARPEGAAALVLLQAPTPQHLAALAGRFAAWLDDTAGPGPGTDLHDLAYTLRSGRAEQPCRLACTARSARELADALTAVASAGARAGARLPAGVHVNDVRSHTADAESFPDDPALRDYLTALWTAGEYGRVGRLWAQGVPVRWHTLVDAGRIVPLPPSVFLRRRIWVDAAAPDGPAPAAATAAGAPATPLQPSLPVPVPEPEPVPVPEPEQARRDAAGTTREERPAAPDAPAEPAGPDTSAAPDDGVLARLLGLVRGRIPDPQRGIAPENSLIELGMDSLNLMSLRFAAEEEFDVELPLDLLGGDAPLSAIAARIGAPPSPASRTGHGPDSAAPSSDPLRHHS
ncbi:SDR family NAD(P)-dependent oxidoreductase [Streptomyces sp. WMMB 714]|uniref:SDR family NAD(P)-dependent oxidoreductase n=1 Tax=Streptomyces sp. WMMB 714 TaxID=1286822 RepID=UPI000697BEA8|nr:SDR family NAD(P)-dependent oxidoreductase [Streptomyces sp. WMMB 714]